MLLSKNEQFCLLTAGLLIQFGISLCFIYIIIWQGSLEVILSFDWFFLGLDFAIRTVSMERVISSVLYVCFRQSQT